MGLGYALGAGLWPSLLRAEPGPRAQPTDNGRLTGRAGALLHIAGGEAVMRNSSSLKWFMPPRAAEPQQNPNSFELLHTHSWTLRGHGEEELFLGRLSL